MFEIEKKVPVPERRAGPKNKYPFYEMKVGDSFAFPIEIIRNIRANAHTYGHRHGKKFKVMDNGEQGRCWRVA